MPIYMQYEGITGEVTNVKYPKWIELTSCQLGGGSKSASMTGNKQNKEASAPTVSEIICTKNQDSSSTGLFKEALQGSGKKVTIVFLSKNESDKLAPYMKIELEGVLVSNYNIGGRGGDYNSKPIESMTLNFTKMTISTMATPSVNSEPFIDNAYWDLVNRTGS